MGESRAPSRRWSPNGAVPAATTIPSGTSRWTPSAKAMSIRRYQAGAAARNLSPSLVHGRAEDRARSSARSKPGGPRPAGPDRPDIGAPRRHRDARKPVGRGPAMPRGHARRAPRPLSPRRSDVESDQDAQADPVGRSHRAVELCPAKAPRTGSMSLHDTPMRTTAAPVVLLAGARHRVAGRGREHLVRDARGPTPGGGSI